MNEVTILGRRRLLLVAALVAAVASTGTVGTSLAAFTSAARAIGSLSAGSWGVTFYLHNNPSPPGAATNAQPDLAMNGTMPSAPLYPSTLVAYSSDCVNSPGRYIDSSQKPSKPICATQNWLSPTFATQHNVAGTGTLTAWWSVPAGKFAVVNIVLYDVPPSGPRVQIGTAHTGSFTWTSTALAFTALPATIDLNASTIHAGDRVELVISANTATQGNKVSPFIGYDTTAYFSSLYLP